MKSVDMAASPGLRSPAAFGAGALLLVFLGLLALAAVSIPAGASPTVTILSPPDSTLTNAPWVIFTAHVDPVNSTADLNGTALALDAGGNVSVNVTLFEGPNQLTLTAVDWEGNTTAASVFVLLDTIPPSLTLTVPSQDETLTNQQGFTVVGNVQPWNATVDVNGNAAPADPAGNFSFSFLLSDGLNVVRVTATDSASNQVLLQRNITWDRYAPFLQVTSPVNGSLTNSTIAAVTGRTETGATVKVQGVNVLVDPLNATFSTSVVLDDLFDQTENLIVIRATDAAGNVAYENRTVIVDTRPPSIDLDLDPAVRTALEAGLPLAATDVNVKGTTDSSDASITIADQAVALVGLSFSVVVILEEGPNEIEITSTDLAGNSRRLTLSITRDTTPPVVTILLPVSTALITNAPTVRLSTETEVGAQILVNGLAPPEVFTRPDLIHVFFEMDIPISEGPNTITVVAIDGANNQGSASVFVLRDSQPPYLVVVEPPVDAVSNASTVLVAGQTEPTGVEIQVNGVPASVDARGNFSALVALAGDLTRIEVLATDRAGNTRVVVREVRRVPADLTPPALALLAPSSTSFYTNKETLEVVGTSDDENASAFIQFVDVRGVLTLQKAPVFGTAEPGVFEFRYTLTLLADGEAHDVTVRLEDLAGNYVFATFTYTCKIVPPFLELFPVPAVVASPVVWVNGSTEPSIGTVEVNGVAYEVHGGFFAARVTLPGDPGTYSITVRVVDLAGNERVEILAVSVAPPPSPLAILVQGIDPEEITAGEPVSLTLDSGFEPPADAIVTWYIDGRWAGEGRSLQGVVFAPGSHDIKVTLANSTWSAELEKTVYANPRAAPLPPPAGGNPYALLLGAAAGVAVAGMVLGGTQAGRYLLVFALWSSVFRRLKKPSPLDHFVRGRLFQVISENPGIHYSELRRRAKVSNGAMSHHLHVLERAAIVRVVIDGTKTRFYPTDEALDEETYGLSDGDREVLSTVVAAPGITETEISARIERSLSTVSRAVDRLGALGYVTTAVDGRTVSVFAREGADVPDAAGPEWPGESD